MINGEIDIVNNSDDTLETGTRQFYVTRGLFLKKKKKKIEETSRKTPETIIVINRSKKKL